MGEEYGETAPFQYFTSHGDPELVEAVRRGRREEFAASGWETACPIRRTSKHSRAPSLDHSLKEKEPHRTLLRFYQQLIRIREELNLGKPGPRTVREVGVSARS